MEKIIILLTVSFEAVDILFMVNINIAYCQYSMFRLAAVLVLVLHQFHIYTLVLLPYCIILN